MIVTFVVIILAVTLSACAQLALKMGVSKSNVSAAFEVGALDGIVVAALSPMVWLGLGIYVVSVAMWLWVLSKMELSVAYPFVGLSFVITMAFGAYFLGENVTPIRLFGTLLIASGCILVGQSA